MTKLKYTEDTYCFETETSITNIGQDELGLYVQTEEIILYPQGGGQPSDTGHLVSTRGNIFNVSKVLNNSGLVNHYGAFIKTDSFNIGQRVTMCVDGDTRLVNAVNHTAGHLLSFVVEYLYPTSKAKKGYHFNDGAYVEFEGLPTDVDLKKIEEEVKKKIESSIIIKQVLTESSEDFDSGKAYRTMSIEGLGKVGCGGTHVNNTSQISSFVIRKIKKGRISYTSS